MTEIAVVLVNWKTTRELGVCLARLQPARSALEVIVVDNDSRDPALHQLKTVHPTITLIENHDNAGFARACNQGLARASAPFVLFLNPDTEADPAALKLLCDHLRTHPATGLVGPQIKNRNGDWVEACRRPFPSLWSALRELLVPEPIWNVLKKILRGRPNPRLRHTSGPAPCLQGSCLMGRRRQLLALGGFDETVPLYLDDGDLCYRYHKNGFAVDYLAEAEVLHHGARSVAQMPNRRLSSLMAVLAHDAFFLKHRGLWQVAAYHLAIITSTPLFLLLDLLLWLPVNAFRPGFIGLYWAKHICLLQYGFSFRFHTTALPPSWPRSILPHFAAYRRGRKAPGDLDPPR